MPPHPKQLSGLIMRKGQPLRTFSSPKCHPARSQQRGRRRQVDQGPAGPHRLASWRVQRFCLVPQPLDAMAKEKGLLTSHTPENPQCWAGRRRKTNVQVLLPLRPLNPHKRTRNSLRFSEIRAPAKCNKAGSRGTGQCGQYLGRGISSGLQAQGEKTAAGLPSRELGACAGSATQQSDNWGRGAKRCGRLRSHPKYKAGSSPGLRPPADSRAHL